MSATRLSIEVSLVAILLAITVLCPMLWNPTSSLGSASADKGLEASEGPNSLPYAATKQPCPLPAAMFDTTISEPARPGQPSTGLRVAMSEICLPRPEPETNVRSQHHTAGRPLRRDSWAARLQLQPLSSVWPVKWLQSQSWLSCDGFEWSRARVFSEA